MTKELRKQWADALRSGKYEQGTDFLRYRDDDGTVRHCCLGVLCELVAPDAWEGGSTIDVHDGERDDFPSTALLAKVELIADEASCYSEMNDNGATFEEIAAKIEAVEV